MSDADDQGDGPRQALRVFIAEDESLITMLLEDILEDLGWTVAGTAPTLREALEQAETVQADVAILDINLAGDPIFPVAERLAARAIPLVFASGYGGTTLPEEWRERPTLPKPFTSEQVEQVLKSAVRQRGG